MFSNSLKVHEDQSQLHIFYKACISLKYQLINKNRRGEAARASYPQFLKVQGDRVLFHFQPHMYLITANLIKKSKGEMKL